jgi:hypothetical protein
MPVGVSSERSILPPAKALSLWNRIVNDRHAALNELIFFRDKSQFLRHTE